MTKYDEKSVVKKEHVKFIADELEKCGSKTPKDLDLKEKHSLANLLYLACGGGKYKLEKNEIMQIRNDQFYIEESAVEYLCQHSPTR